jgi:hypothetical protein
MEAVEREHIYSYPTPTWHLCSKSKLALAEMKMMSDVMSEMSDESRARTGFQTIEHNHKP